ncbi:hypothetical protein CKAH01_12304 [Colletotrichum kahawae]|uniref:Uncharacterized protein n=1 Tax=Colletotrichum kahawae TaxID=34407 RepID=A0AAD9YUJ2_COLKA|nr:hypothetical protein CKAH01_12304 [Colletotrichum kahawae]
MFLHNMTERLTDEGRGYPHRALLVHSVRDDPTPARLQHPIHTTTAPHARPSCRPAVARHEPRAWMPSRPHMAQSHPPDATPVAGSTQPRTWNPRATTPGRRRLHVGSGPNPASYYCRANVWSPQRPAHLGVDELLWIKPWECQPDAVSHNRHVSIAALAPLAGWLLQTAPRHSRYLLRQSLGCPPLPPPATPVRPFHVMANDTAAPREIAI